MTPKALKALAGFLPLFEAPSFAAGQTVVPAERDDGVIQLPFTDYGEPVEAFTRAVYENGWVLKDFNWAEWAQGPEATRLRDDEDTLARATPRQLAQLLTVCIRQDRFVEGALLDAFDSGLILRIVHRAAALTSSA